MKFGIAFANIGPYAHGPAAAEFARAAEEAGFESQYPYDPSGKMPGGEDFDIPDPLIWLTWVAAATTTIRLATGILILPQRNPVVLAKELSTLDQLSGGRVELGIGVGWLEEEFDAIGVPFAERGKRTDEHVAALRALWGEDKATFHGEFTSFDECIVRPRPVNGTIPVHVGGHTDIAARRAGRLGDGFFPGKGDPAELARLIEVARDAAKEHGRDPDAIEMSAGGAAFGSGALDVVKELADVGVSRVMLPSIPFWSGADALKRYGEEVIAKVS